MRMGQGLRPSPGWHTCVRCQQAEHACLAEQGDTSVHCIRSAVTSQHAASSKPKSSACPAHSTLCALVATSGCPSGPRIITPLLRLLWLLPRCHGWL